MNGAGTVARIRVLNRPGSDEATRIRVEADGGSLVLDQPFSPPLPPGATFDAPPPPLSSPPVLHSLTVRVEYLSHPPVEKTSALPAVADPVLVQVGLGPPLQMDVCVEWPWPAGGNQICF